MKRLAVFTVLALSLAGQAGRHCADRELQSDLRD